MNFIKNFKHTTKTTLLLSSVTLSMALSFTLYAKEEKEIKGSIQTAGHTKDLNSLAKIAKQEAENIAKTRESGKITSSKLESEDGSLVYAVVITGADHKAHEILVDAGNGQILASHIEDGNNHKKDEGEEEDND